MSHRRPRKYLRLLNLGFDAEDQLKAIKSMLSHYSAKKAELAATIDEDTEPGAHFEAIYANAAFSMGALGMLAPFVETIFYQGFQAIGAELFSSTTAHSHERWQTTQSVQWDCHFVFEDGKMKRDLTKGIIQISEALGLLERFPIDLGPRIEALFLYRNKMFHHGLEWPLRERTAFERKIMSWPRRVV